MFTNNQATSQSRSRVRAAALVSLVALTSPVIGCRATGIDAAAESVPSTQAASSASDSGRLALAMSMYCQHVAGHETVGPTSSTEAGLRTEWAACRQFEAAALLTAPGDIKASWRIVDDFTRNTQTPVLESHQYDPAALMDEPSAVVAARSTIVAFDHDVCGIHR